MSLSEKQEETLKVSKEVVEYLIKQYVEEQGYRVKEIDFQTKEKTSKTQLANQLSISYSASKDKHAGAFNGARVVVEKL